MRALVVEDELKMAALLRRGLTEEGYAADIARTGDDALWMARAAPYDVIVLDVMLPGRDGFAVCRELRDAGVWAPILMLTARDAVEDRVEGLDSGADDYLTKPFSFAELLARLRALARRGAAERAPVLQIGSLRLDPATRQVWRGDVEVALSAKEFALLETFMRRPGHVLSRLDLLEHAWDYGYENRSNVIDVYVRYLREKIDRPFRVRSIETVRGAGYRLRVDGGVMSRLPIRWRLSLAFALAMAVVLSALGAFLYVRLERSLVDGLDETLELRAAQIQSSNELGSAGDEGLAQLFDRRGRLLESSPDGEDPIVVFAEVDRGLGRGFTLERNSFRVLVTPIDNARVLAVGVTLEDVDDALNNLLAQLLIVGPLALLLASVGGYFLAAAALRPVEAMRREAEAVSAAEPGRRLTLPPANDELRRLGKTLNTMLGRLETALERERRFVADASHELRTPLAMLRAELDLALRRERTPEELDRAVRSAAEETERLSRLAEDLLVLARAEGGELPVRRESVAAAELIDSIAERFRSRADDAGRVIEATAADGLVLDVDRLRAEQALGNLVDNALRHGQGRIEVEARRGPDAAVELHVRDEGPGVSPELAAHAFEPFSRGDAARTGPGAGLGLAIVDVIARAHGGSAHVEGADAWIVLPAS